MLISKFLEKGLDVIQSVKIVSEYLRKFGYLDGIDELSLLKDGHGAKILEILSDRIRKFNRMAGLPDSDIITGKTIKAMSSPRCLAKDHFTESEEAGTLSKWGINNLRYFLNGYDKDISKEEWDESIRVALSYGEAVCNVKFEKVENAQDANFIISLGQGARDDFDGASGVLAWCQLPPSSSFKGQLKSKFDVDETWIPKGKTGRGIYLVNVACHEIVGHGLGVSHHDVPKSLMNPFYDPAIDRPQTEDIRQLQLRYGPAVQSTPTVPNNPTIPLTPSNDKTIITLTGNFSKIEIPGYRVQKIS